MSEPTRRYRIHYLPTPLPMTGWAIEVIGVSLSRGVDTEAFRIGLFVKPAGAPRDAVQLLFLDPAEAVEMRDALDEVLKALAARQNQAN